MERLNRTREALGLFVDGREVLAAHLRKDKSKTALLGLARTNLVRPLGETPEAAIDSEEDAPVELDAGRPAGVAEDPPGEPATNAEVLYRLLARFPVRRCALAVALLPSHVSYGPVANPGSLSGKSLRKHVIESLSKDLSARLDPERVGLLQAPDGQVLSICHDDTLELLDLLDELRPFLGKVRVGLVEPLEMALMNGAHTGSQSAGPAAIVHVGEEASRVIWTNDGHCVWLSPSIQEGMHAPDAVHTVHCRMLLEQDTLGLPSPRRILLSGACESLGARDFFAERFPDARVEALSLPDVDVSAVEQGDRALVSAFAVPIGMALKALGGPVLYPANFLPRARRRKQNPLEVAWHGLLLVSLLAISALFLGIAARDQDRAAESLRLSVELLDQQIREQHRYIDLVADLRRQISDYQRNLALIDTLSSRRRFWSGELHRVSGAVHSTGQVWIARVATSGEGATTRSQKPSADLIISGKALARERAPDLAVRLGQGHIQASKRSSIRGRAVYEFDMRAPALSPEQ